MQLVLQKKAEWNLNESSGWGAEGQQNYQYAEVQKNSLPNRGRQASRRTIYRDRWRCLQVNHLTWPWKRDGEPLLIYVGSHAILRVDLGQSVPRAVDASFIE